MSDLLPPNSTAMEQALQHALGDRIDGLPAPLRELWSAQDCPEALLPWLAWALSIDQWDPAWPLYIRRARVASAIAVQRRKGTANSVLDVIASFGGAVVLKEWFEESPPATPHTFKLLLALAAEGAAPPSAAFIDAVIGEVERTKPARSHFTFEMATTATGRIGMKGVARPIVFARLSAVTAP